MGKNTLPPGFRFHPTDVELVMYYLKRKVLGRKLLLNVIAKVDVYKFAPWDLPDMSCMKTGDLKWYFYCPIEKKYARGDRVNRATIFGYWKATGKDRPVKYNDEVVGMIKTLVFHKGKAPRGDRTDWVMHEYRLEEKILADRGPAQDMYMLYVLFKKDGLGPRNGSQYGAPFKEEEWSDDEQADLPGAGSLCGLCTVAVGGDNSSCVPESVCVGPSVESSGWCTQPSMGHTNGDVNVTTAIDTNACAAPTCPDAPEVPVVAVANDVPTLLNVPVVAGAGSFCGLCTVAVGGDNSSCVPESVCVGPSVESSGWCTQPSMGHTNGDVNVTTAFDTNAYAAPTCPDAPEVPMVAVAEDVPTLLEAPQLALVPQDQESNDNMLSMLDYFFVEDAFGTHEGQRRGNATDSSFKDTPVSDEDDISSLLAPFTDVYNSNNWSYPF
ncbi:hypothetical protein CXB51_030149 [Gossypium anomalum]|uniref:NAC domain-containing protein n=1 Tax=Gossypium anomalum TaxID=47600 RepID=A0A8J5YGI3_9ROSI|nr:hypothetical protein CXB51_030149 [Gossypium anomalum]